MNFSALSVQQWVTCLERDMLLEQLVELLTRIF